MEGCRYQHKNWAFCKERAGLAWISWAATSPGSRGRPHSLIFFCGPKEWVREVPICLFSLCGEQLLQQEETLGQPATLLLAAIPFWDLWVGARPGRLHTHQAEPIC